MTTSRETLDHFTRVVREVQGEFGYLDPLSTAERLVRERIAQVPLGEQIQRKIIRHPTREHLFPGVIRTLSTLLQNGGTIRIWTDDLVTRVARTGLGEIRRKLPENEKWRFAVAARENDKSALLPSLLDEAQKQQAPVVVVDNSRKNLFHVADITERSSFINPLILAWANMYPSQGAEGYRYDGSRAVITDIPQLVRLQEAIGRGGYWLVDLNDTLLDTPAYEESIIHALAGIIFEYGRSV